MFRTLVLIAVLVAFTACSTYIPLGGGRYLKTESSQDPTMWGVSNSYSMLQDCKGTQREGYHYEKLDFSDCITVRTDHGSAPGYGTTLVYVLANALTFGLVAWLLGGGDASATASASSSATATAGKRGH